MLIQVRYCIINSRDSRGCERCRLKTFHRQRAGGIISTIAETDGVQAIKETKCCAFTGVSIDTTKLSSYCLTGICTYLKGDCAERAV